MAVLADRRELCTAVTTGRQLQICETLAANGIDYDMKKDPLVCTFYVESGDLERARVVI